MSNMKEGKQCPECKTFITPDLQYAYKHEVCPNCGHGSSSVKKPIELWRDIHSEEYQRKLREDRNFAAWINNSGDPEDY